MPATIFYSWQSDHPNAVCRSLIERSIEAAAKALNASASIELADRIEVQSGTKGAVGIVPVADTILSRIDLASVVVADLTFVAERTGGGGIPNPNVMLEYGYALRSRSGKRMIAVMNTAFGDPGRQPLPFDLAHMTWPIPYACSVDNDETTRRAARNRLTRDLTRALEQILGDASLPPVAPLPEPHPHDILLLQKVYTTFPLGFRAFLAQHDFGVQFRIKYLEPLHDAAEWVGAAYQFNDRVIEEAFLSVRRLAAELAELTSENIFTSGSHPMTGSVKTRIDREQGTQPSTRKTIRRMNTVAAALADAFDTFETTARARLPVSSLESFRSSSS